MLCFLILQVFADVLSFMPNKAKNKLFLQDFQIFESLLGMKLQKSAKHANNEQNQHPNE